MSGAPSRLGQQIGQVVAELDDARLRFALIGGLALAAHRVVRATSDVDLLVRAEDAPQFARIAAKLGYRCLHDSADAVNYLRGDERLDVLLASRAIARRLLDAAQPRHTPFGDLRVVSAEGLIAFKLQALVNDPRRTRDLEDIRELLRANRATLDLREIRGYFQLFGREALLESYLPEPDPAEPRPVPAPPPASSATDPYEALDDLMKVIEGLCPVWPDKELPRITVGFLL